MNGIDTRDIAERMRLFMAAGGLSPADIAAAAGLSKKKAAKLCDPRKPAEPDLATVVALAQRHGVSMNWLILGKGQPMLEKRS